MRHVHADKIQKWIEDTSVVVESKRADSKWVKCNNPLWLEDIEYRIIDPYAHLKQALKEGKILQAEITLGRGDWIDIYPPVVFAFPVERYRIKPEMKPYSFKDAAFLIGKPVKYKQSGSLQLITRVLPNGVSIGNGVTSYGVLLSNYVFIDGEPCGYLEKS
jgi:hypothetical protein